MAGYSGTPLATKLGIKEGCKLLLVGAPKGYERQLEPLPASVRLVSRLSSTTDIVHVFSSRRTKLKQSLIRFRDALKPAGVVWVSWPKKASKVPTNITEDTVREVALPLGFVDIKVCAIDEVWSGLKLVIRKEFR